MYDDIIGENPFCTESLLNEETDGGDINVTKEAMVNAGSGYGCNSISGINQYVGRFGGHGGAGGTGVGHSSMYCVLCMCL